MDRQTCKIAREELQAMIDASPLEFFKDYEVTVGNASYDSVSATFKVTVKEAGAKTYQQDFAEREAERLGLKLVNGKGDRIDAYNVRAPKFPWIVVKADGKRYKYTDAHIKAEFAA